MRIFFVAMTDSIHTERWINQIADQGWDIHLFPVNAIVSSPELRNITVYGLALLRPRDLHKSVRYVGLLPIGRCGNGFERLAFRKFPKLWGYALELVIRITKPEIVHSLEFQHSAYLTLPVMKKERVHRPKPPKCIATNWGSDIYLFGRLAEHVDKIKSVLAACDYYSCECQHDVQLAKEMGLRGEVLPVLPNRRMAIP